MALPRAAVRAVPVLRTRSRHDVALLLQAPIALPAVALALRWRGLGAVQQRLLPPGRRPTSTLSAPERLAAARAVVWSVRVSAAYSPWPANCLQRSLVLCWFLRRRGLEGELRFGVRRRDDGTLDFHSWVEYEGVVLNDTRDVAQRYATFAPGAAVSAGEGWTP